MTINNNQLGPLFQGQGIPIKGNDGHSKRRARMLKKFRLPATLLAFLLLVFHLLSRNNTYDNNNDTVRSTNPTSTANIKKGKKLLRAGHEGELSEEKLRYKEAFREKKMKEMKAAKNHQKQEKLPKKTNQKGKLADDETDDYDDVHKISKEEGIEMILRGELHLINIDVMGVGESGYNASGEFCELDWKLHKKDPAAYAMFRELISSSPRCSDTRVRVDFKEIVRQARKKDSIADDVHAMDPTGFVFHESRCGSTLVANALAAFDPETTRVYSESQPPMNAINACEHITCDEDEHVRLIQDTIYMMGRTNNKKETNVFYKFQSANTRLIHRPRAAFPNVPWIFVYREAVQTMMSHVKNGLRHAVCTRAKRNPPQMTLDLIKRITGSNSSVTDMEYCAAHLATLCESAMNEHLSSKTGRMINYDLLPSILVDDIIPNYFLAVDGGTLSDEQKSNIAAIATKYSKGMQNRAHEWKEDSATKERKATQEVRDAAAKFLGPVVSFENSVFY